jgi:hypothetical protein
VSDENQTPKLVVDDDWKAKAQAEKEQLAEAAEVEPQPTPMMNPNLDAAVRLLNANTHGFLLLMAAPEVDPETGQLKLDENGQPLVGAHVLPSGPVPLIMQLMNQANAPLKQMFEQYKAHVQEQQKTAAQVAELQAAAGKDVAGRIGQ